MANSSGDKEVPAEPVPGIDPPPTGELREDSGEPESLTKTEAFLLVVSICVSGRQRAASVMKS